MTYIKEYTNYAQVLEGDTVPSAPPQVPQLTYAQRVGAAFVTFIEFYAYIKSEHDVRADQLNTTVRKERAAVAIKYALNMQRAMLALIGTGRRRTYAHDLVYGTTAPTSSTCSSASPGTAPPRGTSTRTRT